MILSTCAHFSELGPRQLVTDHGSTPCLDTLEAGGDVLEFAEAADAEQQIDAELERALAGNVASLPSSSLDVISTSTFPSAPTTWQSWHVLDIATVGKHLAF